MKMLYSLLATAVVVLLVFAIESLFQRLRVNRRSGASGHESDDGEIDYGRKDGWYVELDGRVIGELKDPKPEWGAYDNWTFYTVVPYGAEEAQQLTDDKLWQACRFKFRSKSLGEYAPHAFAGGREPFVKDGVIQMYALYIDVATSK